MYKQWIWLDGRWLPHNQATISVLSHGLHYGTGVFEGIRSYATMSGPRIFKLDAHLERLARGARRLGLPCGDVTLTTLAGACREALERNALGDAYLRPLLFWGEVPGGVAGGADRPGLAIDVGSQVVHTMVTALPWSSHLGSSTQKCGVRATISTLTRNPADAIPPLKLTGGYVNATLAKLAASELGFDEAIFVDRAGLVVEATAENVFAVFHAGGRERVIAVEHPDALPGITRATVLEMTGGESRALALEELLEADEVFLTGTSAEIAPVREIDGRAFGVGETVRRVQRQYADLVRDRGLRSIDAPANPAPAFSTVAP